MRNGNKPYINTLVVGLTGSYRTYEEWKQVAKVFVASGASGVLTVPMRNGNFVCQADHIAEHYEFLPYL